jgi:hypothetical protein
VPDERNALGLETLDGARALIGRLLGVTKVSLERRAQLQRALESRIVLEQAKGVLAERRHVTPDRAFDVLRRAARTHHLSLRALAEDVVGSRTMPPELAATARASDLLDA